ncbi:hypothetical protein ASC61_01945 [Aeromicrobium sp. Root344]|uniref:DUF5677 domain-containing protein n=1 Tax=Aeromicrobium sp. Root344 TaxID=1736521 RepID=UPI0006F76643|nr:DUF5677 domain-containing protein [Aeromicrobium sp. Root344]KQV73868.1 hypothetical protein ASC61_01945 [Aeromicrobium sp. Root344]
MQLVPWLRDTFPDMLWICSLITKYGDKPGMFTASEVLDRITEILDESESAPEDLSVLTGQLSSFDLVPDHVRTDVIAALKADGLYERAFPWELVRGLQKYEEVPGQWILDGWSGNARVVSADVPEVFLRSVIESSRHGQTSTATKAKAMILRAYLQADKLMLPPSIGAEWGDILPRYPDGITEEERQRIEPSIRASAMTMLNLSSEPGEAEAPGLLWAKSFWRQNWKLYECEAEPIEDTTDGDATTEHSSQIKSARDIWQQRLDDLTERFVAKANTSDPDLYIPDRHEVLTGLVYRQVRALGIMVQFPGLWTMEHGSSTLRGLLESRIVVKWLILKDDAELFGRFKDYGRGRLKLLKLHLEEYRDGMDDPPQELDGQIEYLDALVNNDLLEEFQDISIEGNFAGVDTRRMADQVGLLNEYRLVFAPASANVHGEWTAIDQYVLTQCRNPLHRWHRKVNDDPMMRLGPAVVEMALDMLESLVDDYEEGIDVRP